MDEYFDVLDGHGHKTGRTKLRREVHRDGDWHRAIEVFLVNKQREVLLQKRCATKDSWPNFWDFSCGGHVMAGDDVMSTVFRELEEELDFHLQPRDILIYVGTDQSSVRTAPDFINNSFNEVFIILADRQLKDFTFQKSEISDLKYVPLEELRHMVQDRHSDLIVPHTQIYPQFFKVMDSLPNLLP